MNFTVLVPARLASTRLPNKPLADIAGLPMIVRVARNAARSAASRVVVAADHPSIVEACAAHGVEALLTRSDHATGSDRLAEACALLGLDGADLVVNVQGDEPLLDPRMIDACAALLAQRPDCVMSTAAHAIDATHELDNPNVVKVEHIEALEQLRVLWHGERIAVHVSDSRPGPGVDTLEDLARVRALFA